MGLDERRWCRRAAAEGAFEDDGSSELEPSLFGRTLTTRMIRKPNET